MVSVIVNVYNCREYLPTSLESVRQQTYRNLEVILVDDCSTDGSGTFCEEFSKMDGRFRVIHHTQNTGVSGPRNTGLREAIGEYIYFLDGDDYIHEQAIETLIAAIEETSLSVSAYDYYWHASLDGNTHRVRDKKSVEILTTEKVIFQMLAFVDLRWCVAWNKLYKRTLLEGISFHDYYSIQDQDFNLRVFQRIDSIAFVPEKLYWYVENPDSLQNNPSHNAKRLYFNTLNRFKMLDCVQCGKNAKKYRAWIIGYGFLQMVKRRRIEQGTDYEVAFNSLSLKLIRSLSREFLFMRHFSIRNKSQFIVAWFFPRLYEACVQVVKPNIKG